MKRDQSSLYNEATQPNEYEMRDNKKVRFFQGDQPPSLFNFNQSQLNQASLNFDFHFNQTPQLDNHDRELLEKLIKFLDLPYTYKETVIRLINSLASSTAIKKPHENHATITAAIFHTTYQSYLLQNSVSQDELPSFNQQLVNLLIVYKKNANLLTLSNCAFLVNLPKIFYTKILDSFTKIQKNSDNNLNQVSISAERYFNKLTYLTEILKKFGTLYQFFEKMFRIFCFKKFKSPDITEVELDFNQCVFRYCWTLIVFSLELNSVIEKNWCNYGRALCFQIVRFVSGCLTSNQQTSQGVHDLLKLPGNPDSVFGNAWWGVHSQFWLEILKKYPMFEGITVEDLSLAKQNLFKTIILLERSNFFLNTQRTYSEECEMPIFEHSFDVKLQGYFRTNYNGLTHLLDLIYLKSNKRDVLVIPSTNDSDRPLQEKVNFDVDVRVFLTEESSCAFSTTRGRVFKTPFKSKSNATTSRKLVSALKKYSGENNLMLSTPLSVKSVLSSRPKLNEFDLKSLREATIRSIAAEYPSIYHYSESFYKIYEGNELKFREAAATFPSIEEDYKAFRENFSTKDNSIQYQKFSENSCRMSNRFLIMLISQYLRRTRNVTIPVLLKDIQFRRCLLLISAEFIRSVFCSLITFEELLQVTKPNYLELLMLIDLILTCCGNYMDKYTVCRYIEIQERILESEIFKDNAIYEVFDFNKEELKTNPVFMLYDESNLSCQTNTIAIVTKDGIQEHLNRLKTLLSAKIINLHNKRLKNLFKKEASVNINETILQKATKFFTYLFDMEFNCKGFKIFKQRNIDIIMICCLFVAIRFEEGNSTSLNDIINKYQDQPQFSSNYITSIFIDENSQKGDLLCFYNRVFLPKVKNGLNKLNDEICNRPQLVDIKLKCDINGVLLTPVTSRLCTETPLRITQMKNLSPSNGGSSRAASRRLTSPKNLYTSPKVNIGSEKYNPGRISLYSKNCK